MPWEKARHVFPWENTWSVPKMSKAINLKDYLCKLLYEYYKSVHDLKSTTRYASQIWTNNTFYVHIPAKVHILLKGASLGITVSDVERKLVAMCTVIIGTQAKYMLESLNCWSMASTSACLKYHGVLQAFHFLIVNNYLHLI